MKEKDKNNIQEISGYISKIEFNNQETVDINKNSIVVFVGPNNAGKSQSLQDIYNLSYGENNLTVVIKGIKIEKEEGDIKKYLEAISTVKENYYYGMNYNIYEGSIIWNQIPYYGELRNVFVGYLNTENRLNICRPANLINRNNPKSHPIHYASFDSKYRKWLSDSFKQAFGKDLIPNIQFGAEIPLCIGDNVKLKGKYEDEQTRQEEYAKILETYKQVQHQGDGIKSFTGILLYLMLDYYKTFLIDEPESFLHPPQAKIMGQIIGKSLSERQQAFISTHSEEIIKGLLEVCPERVKIIRITRKQDVNKISILDEDKFKKVWNDPLLKYSNIMSSIFHKSVVLCESDSDCKMYSIIESHLKQAKGQYSETLFIHCGGKHRMAKIIKALRSLDIDVKLICDIDVMDDEIIFRGIIEAYDMLWEDIRKDYNTIVTNLHSEKELINRNDAKTTINRILDASKDKNLSKTEIEGIMQAIRTISKWKKLKQGGTSVIVPGNATASFKRMNSILKRNGIFIVTVGELEGFIKEIGGHGPEWTNNVLETYPDLDDEIYIKIKKFIEEMSL